MKVPKRNNTLNFATNTSTSSRFAKTKHSFAHKRELQRMDRQRESHTHVKATNEYECERDERACSHVWVIQEDYRSFSRSLLFSLHI